MNDEIHEIDAAALSSESLERVTSTDPVATMEELQLRAAWDVFSNALQQAENALPPSVSTDFRLEKNRKGRTCLRYWRVIAAVACAAVVAVTLVLSLSSFPNFQEPDSAVPAETLAETDEPAVWDSWDAEIDDLAYEMDLLDEEEQQELSQYGWSELDQEITTYAE